MSISFGDRGRLKIVDGQVTQIDIEAIIDRTLKPAPITERHDYTGRPKIIPKRPFLEEAPIIFKVEDQQPKPKRERIRFNQRRRPRP